MNLFQTKRFQMHSGGYSDFKLECDALTKEDWETLAFISSRSLGYNFKEVFGIPSGGLAFANALAKYSDPTSKTILIADDVLTTGGSIIEFKNKLIKNGYNEKDIKVLVAFSRGKHEGLAETIFTLNSKFWQND